MCHRIPGLSTYGLKAHVREMSTPPKITIMNLLNPSLLDNYPLDPVYPDVSCTSQMTGC